MLNLLDFSSFIEISVVFNFAYAGSKAFRNTLDAQITPYSNWVGNKLKREYESTKSKSIVLLESLRNIPQASKDLEIELTGKSSQQLTELRDYIGHELRKVNICSQRDGQFVVGFKCLYLLSALYGITILICAGLNGGVEYTDGMLLFLFMLTSLVNLFNLLLLLRSCVRKYFHLPINQYIPVAFFTCTLLLAQMSTYLAKQFNIRVSLSADAIVVWVLVTLAMPFICHFIRLIGQWFVSSFRLSRLLFDARRRYRKVYVKYEKVIESLTNL